MLRDLDLQSEKEVSRRREEDRTLGFLGEATHAGRGHHGFKSETKGRKREELAHPGSGKLTLTSLPEVVAACVCVCVKLTDSVAQITHQTTHSNFYKKNILHL